MHNVRHSRIVVGVSGSRASVTALRWAAEEVRRHHGQLRVVRIWESECRANYAPPGLSSHDQQRARAAEGLAADVAAVFGDVPPDNVRTELTEGMAEHALVDRSEGADLLVLGSPSPSSLAGRSIGPVIRTCLSRSRCPVVVVGNEATADHTEDAAIVPVSLVPSWTALAQ